MLFAMTHAAPGLSMCNPATRFFKINNLSYVIVGISLKYVHLFKWIVILLTTYVSRTPFLPSLPPLSLPSLPSSRFLDPPYNPQAPPTPPNIRPPTPAHAYPRPPTPKTQQANDAITRTRPSLSRGADYRPQGPVGWGAHRKRRWPPACHISSAAKCL